MGSPQFPNRETQFPPRCEASFSSSTRQTPALTLADLLRLPPIADIVLVIGSALGAVVMAGLGLVADIRVFLRVTGPALKVVALYLGSAKNCFNITLSSLPCSRPQILHVRYNTTNTINECLNRNARQHPACEMTTRPPSTSSRIAALTRPTGQRLNKIQGSMSSLKCLQLNKTRR